MPGPNWSLNRGKHVSDSKPDTRDMGDDSYGTDNVKKLKIAKHIVLLHDTDGAKDAIDAAKELGYKIEIVTEHLQYKATVDVYRNTYKTNSTRLAVRIKAIAVLELGALVVPQKKRHTFQETIVLITVDVPSALKGGGIEVEEHRDGC